MATTVESIVKDMAKLVDMGAAQIAKDHDVTEEQAILTAFIFTCEWLTENKPELAARWINTLKGDN